MNNYGEKWRTRLVSEAENLGIRISDDQARLIETHVLEVMNANRKFNITTIIDPLSVLEKHILDSLMAGKQIRAGVRVLDMGTGGGFPGIPIKVVQPEIDMTLLDKSRKKIIFLDYLIRHIGLKQINAVQGRVEDLNDNPNFADGFDIVVSRAFASLTKCVKFAYPLIKENGQLLAMKGPCAESELHELLSVSLSNDSAGQARIDSSDIQTISYRLPITSSQRMLVMIRRPKVG